MKKKTNIKKLKAAEKNLIQDFRKKNGFDLNAPVDNEIVNDTRAILKMLKKRKRA